MKRYSLPLALLLFTALLLPKVVQAQQVPEELLRVLQEEGHTPLVVIEELEHLLTQPLNINTATAEELASLPFVDHFFLRNLLLERSRRGTFQSVYDLKTVQGVPPHLHLLYPFLTAEGPSTFAQPTAYSLALVSQHPWHHLRRAEVGGKFSATKKHGPSYYLAFDHDQGEPLLPLRNGFLDHLTATFQYQKQWDHTYLQALLGDYRVATGFGLLLGQGGSFFSRLRYQGTPPALATRTLRPHYSLTEQNFIRGLALRLRHHQWALTLFAGAELLDVNTAPPHPHLITTFYRTGKHTTPQQHAHRHNARREQLGADLNFRTQALTVGLSALLFRHRSNTTSTLLVPPPPYPPKEHHLHSSLYLHYQRQAWFLFAEITLTPLRYNATLLGGSYNHDTMGLFTLLASYVGSERATPYATQHGHSARGRDELALQLAWKGSWVRYWSATFFLEYYTRTLNPTPNYVAQFLLINTRPQSTLQLRLRTHKPSGDPLRYTARLSHSLLLSRQLRLRTALSLTQKVTSTPLGWALSARLSYSPLQTIKAELGAEYFSLPAPLMVVASTLYLPLRPYSPQLRGRGLRSEMALSYTPTAHLRLTARASHTWYQQLPTTPLVPLLGLSATYRF